MHHDGVPGGEGEELLVDAEAVEILDALLLFGFVLACSVILPYLVLLRTALVKNWSGPSTMENFSLEHWRFVFFEFSQTRLAFENTFRDTQSNDVLQMNGLFVRSA